MKTIRLLPLIAAVLVGWFACGAALASHRRPRLSVRVYGYWGTPYLNFYPSAPYPYGYPYPYPPRLPDYALVDTDVSPEKADVYLDGEAIGSADDFDGFPDYLEVSPGRHTLEFREAGYRTLRVDLSARRGRLYQIDRSLRQGGDRSEDHLALGERTPTPRPRGERAPRYTPPAPDDRSGPPRADRDHEPREHPRDEDSDRDLESEDDRLPDDLAPEPPQEPDEEETAPLEEPDVESPPENPSGEAMTSLLLRLRPEEAAVYVDGRFVGAGDSLSGPDGLRIEPGRHTIEVVKPGFRTYRTSITVRSGEARRVSVTLEREPR